MTCAVWPSAFAFPKWEEFNKKKKNYQSSCLIIEQIYKITNNWSVILCLLGATSGLLNTLLQNSTSRRLSFDWRALVTPCLGKSATDESPAMLQAIGLIVLTGALWGCTNPFIRQGTRGLRDVRAASRLGQAYAEIAFLLGNWRYVVPWLVNQTGSLAYLLAVRRAPLSLCVPAANALAFAFTALTGAALGKEDPLDTGSILGISCIVAGTALCCWDKAE